MTDPRYIVPAGDLLGIVPELVLCGAGVLILLLDAFAPRLRRLAQPLTLVAALVAGWACWTMVPTGLSFGGLLESSLVTLILSSLVLLATLLSALASEGFLRRERLPEGEYYALLLWCAAGMVLMLRGTELLTIFVSLELFSVCLYALAGFHRRLPVSTESAIKYFLMGAFVSSFILLGIALVFGHAASTRLDAVAAALATDASPLALLGVLALVAGFGFKMSVAPFHAWAPDTYQGAPSPFVAFLSVAPKVASAMVLVRLLETAIGGDAGRWPELVALLAVLSMVVGNALALVQRDIKRMLAYSGVAHMGYLLVPLAALSESSYSPLLVYLLAYTLMNAGAFIVIALLYSQPGEQHLISDLSGWGYRYPFLGVCLTICLLSLGGIPPTLGFLGKYLVFVHAVENGRLGLALAIVLTSLLGVYYYLRVVYTLYMRPEVKRPDEGYRPDLGGRVAVLIAAAATLLLGIFPARLLELVGRAVDRLY